MTADDLLAVASRVRKAAVNHLPRNLTPDDRAARLDLIETTIGRTLGAVRDLIPAPVTVDEVSEVEVMPTPDKTEAPE